MTDVVLKIENIITSNAPPFDQPWPPALQNGWVLVRAIGEGETLWRRITLADIATINATLGEVANARVLYPTPVVQHLRQPAQRDRAHDQHAFFARAGGLAMRTRTKVTAVKARIDGAELCHAKRSSPKHFPTMVSKLRQDGSTDAEIIRAMMESKVIIDALGSRPPPVPRVRYGKT